MLLLEPKGWTEEMGGSEQGFMEEGVSNPESNELEGEVFWQSLGCLLRRVVFISDFLRTCVVHLSTVIVDFVFPLFCCFSLASVALGRW